MSPADELPVGTVTFLFTDIEGSTRLLKQLRDRYGEALAEHQRILREAFAAHDGHEIDTQGDSFFVAFARARRTRLRPRSTVSVGSRSTSGRTEREFASAWASTPASRQPGDERYVGLGVHRAARICAAGHGGQVLVSQATRELLRDDPIPRTSRSETSASTS